MGIGCRRRLTDGYQQKYVCWEGHEEGLWGKYWGDRMASGSEMTEGEMIPLQCRFQHVHSVFLFHNQLVGIALSESLAAFVQ